MLGEFSRPKNKRKFFDSLGAYKVKKLLDSVKNRKHAEMKNRLKNSI